LMLASELWFFCGLPFGPTCLADACVLYRNERRGLLVEEKHSSLSLLQPLLR
jgi:hypothetical protein